MGVWQTNCNLFYGLLNVTLLANRDFLNYISILSIEIPALLGCMLHFSWSCVYKYNIIVVLIASWTLVMVPRCGLVELMVVE